MYRIILFLGEDEGAVVIQPSRYGQHQERGKNYSLSRACDISKQVKVIKKNETRSNTYQ
jgi:hypothetical protein